LWKRRIKQVKASWSKLDHAWNVEASCVPKKKGVQKDARMIKHFGFMVDDYCRPPLWIKHIMVLLWTLITLGSNYMFLCMFLCKILCKIRDFYKGQDFFWVTKNERMNVSLVTLARTWYQQWMVTIPITRTLLDWYDLKQYQQPHTHINLIRRTRPTRLIRLEATPTPYTHISQPDNKDSTRLIWLEAIPTF
jgi:hypothetical protein